MEEIVDKIRDSLPALALTGAGVSTASGIPTYRNHSGVWQRSDPITHQEFTQRHDKRQRYWGRSMRGWPAVRAARPNPAHRHLAELESKGAVTQIVTQNVDRLHQRAGSDTAIDLHGRLDRVVCLSCGSFSSRDDLQARLLHLNPRIHQAATDIHPDGDADIDEALIPDMKIANCMSCGGTLMPDVVFFGGSIPAERVQRCKAALESAGSLLVVGSSLQVYSGFRFCRWAQAMNKPIFLINPGKSRADDLGLRWPVNADAGLKQLLNSLTQTGECVTRPGDSDDKPIKD
ncbi:MAG: NAD-dependent protein deacetylase [Congregibacter sp.]